MESYIPEASSNEGARERNQNLPGMGGIYNSRNLQTYHYAGNNPLVYTDPTGEIRVGNTDITGSFSLQFKNFLRDKNNKFDLTITDSGGVKLSFSGSHKGLTYGASIEHNPEENTVKLTISIGGKDSDVSGGINGSLTINLETGEMTIEGEFDVKEYFNASIDEKGNATLHIAAPDIFSFDLAVGEDEFSIGLSVSGNGGMTSVGGELFFGKKGWGASLNGTFNIADIISVSGKIEIKSIKPEE